MFLTNPRELKDGRDRAYWQLLECCRTEHAPRQRVVCRVGDLPGLPAGGTKDDRLYRAVNALLPRKVELEKHPNSRLGQLFSPTYDLLPYDVASTHRRLARRASKRLRASMGVRSGSG